MGGAQLAAMGRGDGGRARVLQADIPVARPYSLAVRSRMVDLQAQITQTQREVTTRLIGAQRGLLAALAGVCVVVAVIGVGGVVVVRRWLLAPFTALRRAAESVAAGEFGTRGPAGGPAGLGDLGRAPERMRTRLVGALAEAERAEDSFRGLFEASPDAVVTVAGDGSIVMVNAQAGRMFGYTKTELAGQPASILVPEAVRRANTDRDAGFYTNPAAWPVGENLQRTAVDKDWREFPIEASLSSLPAAAPRAAGLPGPLLIFARRDVIHPELLDLGEVAAGLEQLLRRTLGEHIDLILTPAPGLWPVTADAGQLEQVLVNLAVNARDAMPGGGKLTIDTANVTVDAAYATSRPALAPGRYARLRVSDPGTWLHRATLARVFEPFYTTKPVGHGHGLRPATVYAILTGAGGHAEIYSEPGLRTTTTALLPAAAAAGPAAAGSGPAAAPEAGPR